MTITIEVDDATGQQLLDAFSTSHHLLKAINKKLDRLLGEEAQQAIDTATLIAKVEAQTTLDESIKALIEGLGEDPALAGLTDKLKGSSDALLAAVRANTV